MKEFYVILMGKFTKKYVKVWARNKDEAYNIARIKYTLDNVSNVYTARFFAEGHYEYLGYTLIGELNKDKHDEILRKKRII